MGLPPVPAEEPLATKTRTRTRIRTRSHATATERQWTATEPPRLSMVPQLPITERPATRLRWRPTNQWSPMLPPPSATRPPQLTQPPPPLTIMPHQAQVMELQAMATAPPALGMELQTVPAEGLLVTKIRTKTRPLVMKTAMDPRPTIPPPTKLSPTNRLATRCTRPIILQTTRTSVQSLTLRSAQR